MNRGKLIGVERLIPRSDENDVLEKLNNVYTAFSEMSYEERQFLNSLVIRSKPKKLLEIGISAGASSVVILNAIKNMGRGLLYSIDYSTNWYQDKTKKSGFLVESYPELKSYWKLFTGALSYKFIEEIGGKIDFCLIDTKHINPGEILDFLMVFPFLKKNCLVVFHDTNLHTIRYPYDLQENLVRNWPLEWLHGSITNNLLISSIQGKKKIIVNNFVKRLDDKIHFGNIAGIRLNSCTKKCIFNVFNLLSIKWQYTIPTEERQSMLAFFEKYYDPFYIEYLGAIFDYHDLCFSQS